MVKPLKIALIDEERRSETTLMVDMPLNKPIVWKNIKTPMGTRLGFSLYKKWWEFWK